jgi:type I restriction enzyme S subunit
MLEEGFPVYGANGIIGYYSEYNHSKPTVLITCRGATCGTINVCKPQSYVTGNAMALDDLDEEKISLEFLVLALKGTDFRKAINGVAQPQITRQSLKHIQIPLPPLEEQKRIAEILDAADALRSKRREALTKLDDLLQSTFLDMFGDPVTNPKGWEVAELGKVAKFINGDRGHNYPSKKDFVNEGIPFINAGHLSDGKVNFTNMNYISEARFNKLGSGKTKRQDILYCLRGSLGKTAIVQYEDNAAIASSLVIIRPFEKYTTEYLYRYLVSPFGQREIRRFDNGSSQPNLSVTSVKKYALPLPPLDVQQRFAKIVTSVEEQKAKMRKHLEQLDDLFASLQQRAFRGDL